MIADLLKSQKELVIKNKELTQIKPKYDVVKAFEKYLVNDINNYEKFLTDNPKVTSEYADTLDKSFVVHTNKGFRKLFLKRAQKEGEEMSTTRKRVLKLSMKDIEFIFNVIISDLSEEEHARVKEYINEQDLPFLHLHRF